jgi:hypothetical protein
MGNISGDETSFNGRTVYEADLSELMDALGGFGMADMQGAQIETLKVWIDVETNTIVGMTADMVMPAELVGDVSGESMAIRMDFSLNDFNDPALEIDLP